MSYVYILKSLKNQTHYIGCTNNLNARIKGHINGRSRYTRSILPVSLVFSQEFPNFSTARKVESWLKRQKSRVLLEKIILEGKINNKF